MGYVGSSAEISNGLQSPTDEIGRCAVRPGEARSGGVRLGLVGQRKGCTAAVRASEVVPNPLVWWGRVWWGTARLG